MFSCRFGIHIVLFSWACRLSFFTFYLAQALKMLTKKYELHYCSAFIEVRSGGTIGAYAITWSRPIAITNSIRQKLYELDRGCPNRTNTPAGTIFQDIKISKNKKRFRCTLFCTMGIIHVKVSDILKKSYHFLKSMHCDLDLLTLKSIGHILASWRVCMWSFMMIGVKGKQLCARNHFQ